MRISRRTRRTLLLIILVLVAVGIVAGRRLAPSQSPASSGLMLNVMSPALRAVAWVDRTVAGVFQGVISLFTARGEVERLTEENAELRREIAALSHALRRLGELPGLTAAAEALTLPTVAVEVLSRQGTVLLINAGSDEGVRAGSPVVAPRGLVGTVIETAPHIAMVRLMTEENVSITALIASGERPGLIHGRGALRPLSFLPEDQGFPLHVGQEIITAGHEGSLYPPGIPIGVISEIGATERGLLRAMVEPHADLRRLSGLLVVIGPPPRLRALDGRALLPPVEPLVTSPEVTALAATAEMTALPATAEALAASPEVTAGTATAEAEP
ncbi:rod shape-determining protein MreC [Candidatus Sumerlaeota bacterium]|nr:rod shape-determining protein MreC [Candidatus Sumerlaeota bacterium]